MRDSKAIIVIEDPFTWAIVRSFVAIFNVNHFKLQLKEELVVEQPIVVKLERVFTELLNFTIRQED